MNSSTRYLAGLSRVVCFLGASLLIGQNRPPLIEWMPVTDAERQISAPEVDANASVEALFWKAYLYDEFLGQDVQRVLHHYVRLKVFNAAGKEKASSLDIEFDQGTFVDGIAGRTIKSDGSILELAKDGIHDRELVRLGRLKRHVKTLSMPGVEPGAIVEYRWKEIHFNPRSWYFRAQFQREYPVRKVTYFFRPITSDYAVMPKMTFWPFNCKPSPLQLDRDGFSSTTLENAPAFEEEPLMMGQPNVRAWGLLFYRTDNKREPEKYWNEVGKDSYQTLKRALKVTDEVKQATDEALASTKESDKTLALLRYVRKRMRSLYASNVTAAERSKILKDMPKDRWRSSSEVLKSGIGTPDELNTLFAAMATHAGLEVLPALVADRDDVIFNPQMAERYFLRNVDLAVKDGDAWKLLDVSATRLPTGMLAWREEAMEALVCDPKKPFFIKAVASQPEASETKRTAKLTLSEDGTIEGDIEESFTGHAAESRRADLDGESDERRQEMLKERITASIPKAELQAIAFANVDDPDAPLKMRYHIKLPDYGQRTGKRLFFQPLVMQRGDPPLFAAADRKYDVFFHYAWKEVDEISIKLPDGFQLDNPEAPEGMSFGKPGEYKITMGVENGTLISRREIVFGRNGLIGFPKATYPALKRVFDEIHRRDGHTLALRQAVEAPTGR